VVIIFVMGFRGYLDMATTPANAYPITVIAQKWSWAFQYPNGYVDANLHVPVDRPIQLILTSRDVIHSLFVPAFRIKKDAVPGRYNRAWFEATKINDAEGFDLFCAEYCGTSHSKMVAKVFVHDPTAFARWLDEAGKWEGRISPVQRGQELYRQRGCAQCHSIDGSANTGPTLKNVWDEIAEGKTTFTDGSKLAGRLGPDFSPEDYVRESLYKPQAKIVQGFTPAMPSYEGQIRDNDMPAIIAYLKSLSDKRKGEADATVSTKPVPVPPAGNVQRPTAPSASAPAGQGGLK
jgi:cytochrome c oxidase subunit II